MFFKVFVICLFVGLPQSFAQNLAIAHEVQSRYKKLAYARDIYLWGKDDYWATSLETLREMSGDCEDIAIAKFFSMLSRGVDVELLRLSYVYQRDQIHMVLEYSVGSKVYVLDNQQDSVYKSDQHYNSKVIASFNHQYLWVGGRIVDSAIARLAKWNELLIRVPAEDLSRLLLLEELLE